MFAYAANNPIKYTVPDGRYSDEWIKSLPPSVKQYTRDMPPNRFSQQLWTVDKGFKFYFDANGKKKFFWQTACLATAILNVVSAVYQKETGNIMTEELAIKTLNAAIATGNINEKNAYVSDIAGAANDMASFLNLQGKFSSDEKSPQFMIYAIDKTTYSHFVNTLKNIIGSVYFDVWDGKTKSYSITSTDKDGNEITQNLVNLQEGRPIRGLNYKIPYKNWAMIEHESMKE